MKTSRISAWNEALSLSRETQQMPAFVHWSIDPFSWDQFALVRQDWRKEYEIQAEEGIAIKVF